VKGSDPKFPCSVCGKAVVLETANTDDEGCIVHGECYLTRITLQFAVQSLIYTANFKSPVRNSAGPATPILLIANR